MASVTDVTPRKIDVFINMLAKCGVVSKACKAAGISRMTAYRYRENDPVFKDQWDEAIDIAVENMEAEAQRRAVEGVLKPVYQKGTKVGTVREYSDTLLIFLLKAHKPKKYRDNATIEHTGAGGGPIDVKITIGDIDLEPGDDEQ
jgi:hypothetical protein